MKIFIYAAVFLCMCLYFAYLIWKNGSKVKRLEKFCDKLRDDKRLALNYAKDCDVLILDYAGNTTKVFDKLKPLCYQIDLGAHHTIFLCLNLDDKTFYIVTLYGDATLVPLNYKLVLDGTSNKIKVYSSNTNDITIQALQSDFSNKLMKYCEV